MSRGLAQLVPKYKLLVCYDCDSKPIVLTFNQESDRYEGTRICYICVLSFKRKAGAFSE